VVQCDDHITADGFMRMVVVAIQCVTVSVGTCGLGQRDRASSSSTRVMHGLTEKCAREYGSCNVLLPRQ